MSQTCLLGNENGHHASNYKLLIPGDFNAHLRSLGGVCGSGNPNVQGILLADIMDRHNLCAVSQCEWATGHLHTYASENSMTTVDYIIVSLDATSIISPYLLEAWANDNPDLTELRASIESLTPMSME